MYVDVGVNYLCLVLDMDGKKKEDFHEGSGDIAKQKEWWYACEQVGLKWDFYSVWFMQG